MSSIRLLPLLLLTATFSVADMTFPAPDWKDDFDPIACPYAVKGGTLRFAASQPPKSLNAYIDNNTYTRQVFDMMFETLLGVDNITAEFVPYLACRWTISDDQKTFTFTLDSDARWSDGVPVSAEDVKWTFDQIMNPKHATGASKVALGVFDSPEIIDARTVRFRARVAHWRNLLALGTFEIMPKHVYGKLAADGTPLQNFNSLDLDDPIVSGPYRLSGVKEQVEIRLSRRPDWWFGQRKAAQNTMNFDTIIMRYYSSNENAFEAFKKKQVDVYAVYNARIWANETIGERFDKNWIVKQRVFNHEPGGFQGFAMNMRRPPFNDPRVREAMCCLVDRETMNRTMMFNEYMLFNSYFQDLYDTKTPCSNATFTFNIDRAKALLAEAGYAINPAHGFLEKDGKPFSFTFLSRAASEDKFLALFASALREVGIEIKIDRKDFAGWMRDMDAFNFEMTWASWGGTIFSDPENMWYSAEAERKSGNNITGFRDAEADAIIMRQSTCFDIQERNAMLRTLDAIIYKQIPYVLLWGADSKRILYWNQFGVPAAVLSKFGDERTLISYWYYDADSAAELRAAMKTGAVLPRRTVNVRFDDIIPPTNH